MTVQNQKVAQLVKDQEINLTEIDPALKRVLIGLGWDAPEKADGNDVDIDASAFLLGGNNRVRNDLDFVFYNNLETEAGAVRHRGDNTTGKADGDDEEIEIDLQSVPFDVDKIAFCVTIHNAEERNQTFGLIRNSFIRVVDQETNRELARFDMTEDAANENGMIFGELIRDMEGWKFHAIGQGTDGGLYRIARDYGVNVVPN